MLIPKYDGPAEGARHAAWLQERSVDQGSRIDSLETEVARLARMIGAIRRAPKVAPEPVQSGPLPEPYRTGMVLRALGDGSSPQWVPDWQGLIPTYYVNLSPAGGSYEVGGMGVGADSSDVAAKAALPPVMFDAGGRTMLTIRSSDHADAPSPGLDVGQPPMVLFVTVNPTFAGEVFSIYAPADDNPSGTVAPYYKLAIINETAFDAMINLYTNVEGTYYAGTNVLLMGSPTVNDLEFTVAAGTRVAWHIENFISGSATPVYASTGWLDPYFAANLA